MEIIMKITIVRYTSVYRETNSNPGGKKKKRQKTKQSDTACLASENTKKLVEESKHVDGTYVKCIRLTTTYPVFTIFW